ncbi:hypothetical protein DI43_08410 [Geobacillus sp. CAMR12739]|nr:hypothetical protein DI43_08410 [Geobacillus sp. CAMR12739]
MTNIAADAVRARSEPLALIRFRSAYNGALAGTIRAEVIGRAEAEKDRSKTGVSAQMFEGKARRRRRQARSSLTLPAKKQKSIKKELPMRGSFCRFHTQTPFASNRMPRELDGSPRAFRRWRYNYK